MYVRAAQVFRLLQTGRALNTPETAIACLTCQGCCVDRTISHGLERRHSSEQTCGTLPISFRTTRYSGKHQVLAPVIAHKSSISETLWTSKLRYVTS